MAWTRAIPGFFYPRRHDDGGGPLSDEEIEAWVEATGTEYFQQIDDVFVNRARTLGVTSGMVLDLNRQVGLVAMKLLWHEEDLLSMGVYRSLPLAERARETAEDWGLDGRMFFQVAEPKELRFKTGYFDLVVSDGLLQASPNPLELLEEIERVVKPGGAVLLGHRARPVRFRMPRILRREGSFYPQALKSRFEATVRAGYTVRELEALVAAAGLARARVVTEGETIFIERPGANDPSSWVSERERYN